MKIRRFLVALFALAFGASTAAYACSISFLGYSDWDGGSVSYSGFAADFSCPGSFQVSEDWDFGDTGTGSGLAVDHQYANPGQAGAFQAMVTLHCADSCQISASRWVCFTIGVMGCIAPNVGWN